MNFNRMPTPGGSPNKPEKTPGLSGSEIAKLEADIQCKLAVGLFAQQHPDLGLEGKKLSEIPEAVKNEAMMFFIETGGAAHFREMREANELDVEELNSDSNGIRETLTRLGITLQ